MVRGQQREQQKAPRGHLARPARSHTHPDNGGFSLLSVATASAVALIFVGARARPNNCSCSCRCGGGGAEHLFGRAIWLCAVSRLGYSVMGLTPPRARR
jgi:hypothetical protein